MPRKPPTRTPEQQKAHDRRQALASLDVAAMRAWAAQYAIGLLGDDRTVLISMHETRVLDPVTPRKLREESTAWLQTEHPESAALAQVQRFPAEFRGPRYSKAKGIDRGPQSR